VHGLVAEKCKPVRPSTSAGGPRHQDHAKMNACILGNAMTMQRRNDHKVASRARAKAKRKWNHLVALARVSTTPKTTFGHISFRAIVESVGL